MRFAANTCPVLFETLENGMMLSVSPVAHHHAAPPPAAPRHSPPPLAAHSVALPAVQVTGAADPIFMQVTGVKGDVTTPGFVNDIEVSSFSWGISNTAHAGSAGSGASAGKVSFSNITITKTMDSASQALVQDALGGKSLKTVTLFLTVPSQTDTPTTYAKYTLANCLISSYSVSSGGDIPTESISLNFTKVTFTYMGTASTTTPGT